MSCQSNSTAVCLVAHFIETEAPELQLKMCAVARYYDISSKANRGYILIIHDKKNHLIAHPYAGAVRGAETIFAAGAVSGAETVCDAGAVRVAETVCGAETMAVSLYAFLSVLVFL